MEFVETFPYVIRYKQGKENIVAGALSWRYVLISTLDAKLLGFEHIKNCILWTKILVKNMLVVKK